jgi:hypothetical protein
MLVLFLLRDAALLLPLFLHLPVLPKWYDMYFIVFHHVYTIALVHVIVFYFINIKFF